ncbi:hypothetical protein [Streptomyces sp. NPDC047123]|uniref:hypothetical protein n=1 Tax=Streptomyces sp. NPDC047123 TaxID=3155622 RepID=UPI0033F4DC0E
MRSRRRRSASRALVEPHVLVVTDEGPASAADAYDRANAEFTTHRSLLLKGA